MIKMENYFLAKKLSVEPMIQKAILVAKDSGLNLHAGIPNNGDGDCALEAIIDQLLSRECFQSNIEENYNEGDPQFYREKWFREVENVAWKTNWSVGYSEEEWKLGWEIMRQPRQYEHPLGDLVMPGITHCIGKDILIINTSNQVTWCYQVVLASSLIGKHSTTEIPIIVAYDQVHFEGLVPNTEEDIVKSIELKNSLLSNAITIDSNNSLKNIYNVGSQESFADALKKPVRQKVVKKAAEIIEKPEQKIKKEISVNVKGKIFKTENSSHSSPKILGKAAKSSEPHQPKATRPGAKTRPVQSKYVRSN